MAPVADQRDMICIACGYPLAHLRSYRCPECGTAFVPDDPRTWATPVPRAHPNAILAGSFSGAVVGCALCYWLIMLSTLQFGPAVSYLLPLLLWGELYAIFWWSVFIFPIVAVTPKWLAALLHRPLLAAIVGAVYGLVPTLGFMHYLGWFGQMSVVHRRCSMLLPVPLGLGTTIGAALASRRFLGKPAAGPSRIAVCLLWISGPVLSLAGTLSVWLLLDAAALVRTKLPWVE
jgi:hypothetical protein